MDCQVEHATGVNCDAVHVGTVRVRNRATQSVSIRVDNQPLWLTLPAPDCEIAPGIRWGDVDECYRPAFWCHHAWRRRLDSPLQSRYALGADLGEEVAACLLGGFGVRGEIGVAAFEMLRAEGLLSGSSFSAGAFERALRVPLRVGARSVRYRFPALKGRYLALALSELSESDPPIESRELRNWLQRLPGVGPKTASWIVRNRDATARVAILDIHIVRACQIIGLFPGRCSLPRDYDALEQRFLWLADQMCVAPSDLDATMWAEMRVAPAPASKALSRRRRADWRD